jgi:hypothetical protein
MRLDFLDHGEEIAVFLALPLFAISSIWYLRRRELVLLALEQQAGLVDTPG